MSSNPRTPDHPIDAQFLGRWSPRAYSGEAIPEATLKSLLEAARWAPSSYNQQPWRFIYARRDTAHWAQFLGFLNEFNQSWAKNASALVFVISKTTALPPARRRPYPRRRIRSMPAPHGAIWRCRRPMRAGPRMAWSAF